MSQVTTPRPEWRGVRRGSFPAECGAEVRRPCRGLLTWRPEEFLPIGFFGPLYLAAERSRIIRIDLLPNIVEEESAGEQPRIPDASARCEILNVLRQERTPIDFLALGRAP
jgi:hypothetical protein